MPQSLVDASAAGICWKPLRKAFSHSAQICWPGISGNMNSPTPSLALLSNSLLCYALDRQGIHDPRVVKVRTVPGCAHQPLWPGTPAVIVSTSGLKASPCLFKKFSS